MPVTHALSEVRVKYKEFKISLCNIVGLCLKNEIQT